MNKKYSKNKSSDFLKLKSLARNLEKSGLKKEARMIKDMMYVVAQSGDPQAGATGTNTNRVGITVEGKTYYFEKDNLDTFEDSEGARINILRYSHANWIRENLNYADNKDLAEKIMNDLYNTTLNYSEVRVAAQDVPAKIKDLLISEGQNYGSYDFYVENSELKSDNSFSSGGVTIPINDSTIPIKQVEALAAKFGGDAEKEITAMARYKRNLVQTRAAPASAAPAPAPATAPNLFLNYGSSGDKVTKLQQALKALGFDLGTTGKNKDGIDGDFGKATATAIDTFLKRRGDRRRVRGKGMTKAVYDMILSGAKMQTDLTSPGVVARPTGNLVRPSSQPVYPTE